MKKTLTRIFAITVLIISTLSLVACNIFVPTPNLNLEEAKENLEENDYFVSYANFEDDEIGAVGIYSGLTEMLSAEKIDDSDDMVLILVFNSKKLAKHYYKYFQFIMEQQIDQYKIQIKYNEYMLKKFEDELDSDEIDDYEDEIKELKKDLEEAEEEGFMGIRGKTIWIGTKNAIDDTK